MADRLPKRRLILWFQTALMAFALLFGVLTALGWIQVWHVAALAFFVGFGQITFFATSNTTLQRRVPDAMRGRVMGVYAFVFMGFFPIGSLQAGLLAHGVSAPFAWIFGAAVCALAAIFVVRLIPPAHESATKPQAVSPAVAPESG